MDDIETIAAFAALAQTTRLDTFRLLVAREPDGVPAGELARLMAVPQNTMSAQKALYWSGLPEPGGLRPKAGRCRLNTLRTCFQSE